MHNNIFNIVGNTPWCILHIMNIVEYLRLKSFGTLLKYVLNVYMN